MHYEIDTKQIIALVIANIAIYIYKSSCDMQKTWKGYYYSLYIWRQTP